MTNKKFRDSIHSLGLNQSEAARLLGLKLRAVHGYCKRAKVPVRVEVQLAYFLEYGMDLAESIIKG